MVCYHLRMHLKKFVSLWALLALLLGQVALAQHSANHTDHGVSFELSSSHSDDHDHQEKSKKHQCPECVLTKSLQTAFYNAPVTLSFNFRTEVLLPQQYFIVTAVNHYNSNSPRAPPAILI